MKTLCFILLFAFGWQLRSQNLEPKIITYNTLVGAITGGIGSLINKKKDQKWHKTFAKGFAIGAGGGAIVYSGKKLNSLIALKQNLAYGWVSRAVFSAGNSIVENAAANRDFWSQWHYDVGFIRLEYKAKENSLIPRFMPSTFGGMLFMTLNSTSFDYRASLRSGTFTFYTDKIRYEPRLVGSTASNGFLFTDTLTSGKIFYDTYAHEMVHAFQFHEFSGVNHFFDPLYNTISNKHPKFKKISKWVYIDASYEAMLINYFIVNQGPKGKLYCRNYLENEAEFLSVRKHACDY
ncbi:MAG: hypothetical protein H0W73_07985 [Bacteroidetes bacterium]|nr:hypothetical protein [Bacteroidota bacterium]